jgi:hypothetical protein
MNVCIAFGGRHYYTRACSVCVPVGCNACIISPIYTHTYTHTHTIHGCMYVLHIIQTAEQRAHHADIEREYRHEQVRHGI